MKKAVIAFGFLASVAAAHDWWIRPDSFRAAAGALVRIEAFVGHDLEGEAFVRKPDHIAQFVVTDPSGAVAHVLGQDGKAPVGFVRPKEPGVYLLGYLSQPRRLELEAEKFKSYLEEEGLDTIVLDREKRGEAASKATESYRRCAKSLLMVGDSSVGDATRKLGFAVEIVPDQDPMLKDASEEQGFVVLADGKPLPGIRVVGVVRDEKVGALRSVATTDAEGRVRLKFPGRGPCIVKTVHMKRAAPGADTQWESWWATLTFAR